MAFQPLTRAAQGSFLPLITRRPVAICMFMIAIAVLGVVSFTKLHTDRLPEKRIKRELETIPGIAAVQVRGGLQEEIRIRVDPFKMAAQDLDPALLGTRLAQENLNASGGLIREGSSEYLVRTLNEFRNVEEIENLAIVRRGNAVIRIKDIGSVSRTHAEREVVTRIGDHEAVEIAVFREAA